MTATHTPTPTAPARATEQPPPATWSTLWLVVQREVRSRGRTKSFVISTLFMVGVLVALIVVPTMVTDGGTTHELGITGPGSAAIADSATQLTHDDDVTIEVTTYPDANAAEAAVRDDEVTAALIDAERVIVPRTGGFGSSALVDLLQQAAGAAQARDLLPAEHVEPLAAALSGQALDVQPLAGQDAAHTEARTWLAYGGALIMWTLIIGYGTWALNGVTEEKANRVIEILLSAAPASHLFAGKIIGIGLLGLMQFAAMIGAALIAIQATGAFELPAPPLDFAAVLTLWVLLGFAMYLVLFGCAGALASKLEDAQSAMSPIMTIALVGFFASFVVLGNPDGRVATISTFVPFTAPYVVPIRVALEAIPLWQHLLAIGITTVTAFGLTLLAGRVYRGGALQFAGKVAWRSALRHEA